jgi:hypothetical protein
MSMSPHNSSTPRRLEANGLTIGALPLISLPLEACGKSELSRTRGFDGGIRVGTLPEGRDEERGKGRVPTGIFTHRLWFST